MASGPSALQVTAIGNLVLFLIAFRLFVGRLVRGTHAPFYTLVFVLVLWGSAPWRWSSFLNPNSLGFGLPCPSMFATLIALFTLWALVILLERRRRVWVFGAVVVGTVILLTHPITAIATSVGAAALIVSSLDRHDWCTFLRLAVAAVTVVLLALAWPYCSLVDLLSLSSIYTGSHGALYEAVLQRTFPALVAVPVIAQSMRRNWRHSLGLMFLGGCAVYLWGWLSGYLTHLWTHPFVHPPRAAYRPGRLLADPEHRPRPGSYRPLPAWALYGGIAALLLVGIVGVSPGSSERFPVPCC